MSKAEPKSKKTKKSKKTTAKATVATHAFQAETKQVLQLMINSLYSNKEIFLRELISNASDALDRLRFDSLQNADLNPAGADLQIEIEADKEAGTLTIRDNGIGMTHEDVMNNIGTIAKSGTRHFLEQLADNDKSNSNLIGQFGVGFYSAFIVADSVTVLTRLAGSTAEQGVRWQSDGGGEFTIGAETLESAGTSVILTLKDDEKDYLNNWTLKSLIQTYSDHIGFPIQLLNEPTVSDDEDGEEGEEQAETEAQWEQVNKATALWALPKNEIKDDQYQAFYKSLSHDMDDPMCWAHNKVEGTQSYTTLLYVPKNAPFDMMLQRDERTGLRLYVKRVFIMDGAQTILPQYLRFIRGVVDSQDLPLNVSRELLQENELVSKIRSAVIRRSLDMIGKLNGNGEESYADFWGQFGAVLKEGVVEDFGNRERILKLLRFSSTHDEAAGEKVDLDSYLSRMKVGQEHIYYITAEHKTAASNSPHLEVFRKKGIEVLLMSDRVDEWMMGYLNEYEGKSFKSVAKGDIDLSTVAVSDDKAEEKTETEESTIDADILKKVTEQLAGQVSEVRASQRLTDSASCLVLSENEVALHLQKMLKQAGQEVPDSQPILELNSSHPLVSRLVTESDEEQFGMLSLLLFEQALLSEGGSLSDPAGFVRRINTLMTSASSKD
jgi:molecular chaperone HtpG